MKNILIPVDFSEHSMNALEYVQNLFAKTSCNFFVLHISDYIDQPVYHEKLDAEGNLQLIKEAPPSKRQLTDFMQVVENNFDNDKHRYIALHEHGFFIETLKKNLELHKIDMVAMGTKGVSGLREKIIGSNTGDVITKVKCDILAIPKSAKHSVIDEIAFPTDFNIFYSHKILNSITEMLEIGDGNLRVMNVSKKDTDLNSAQIQNRDYLYDYLNESFPGRNSFHTITNKRVNAAIQCFVESRDIDMIIMVAKNLNFLQQVFFDSLVEKISFHTKVPFLVLHE